MSYDWFDEYTVTSRRNIAGMLQGNVVQVNGDAELGEQELELWVESVTNVIVGIDSRGLFAGIEISASVGPFLEGANPLRQWTLLADGAVLDDDDLDVGRHSLATLPGSSGLTGVRSQVMS